jgi:carbonic anhydrase
MRFLIALLACTCALTEAAASDTPSIPIKPAAAEAAASTKPVAAPAAKPIVNPATKQNLRSMAAREAEEVKAAEALAAKISARLAKIGSSKSVVVGNPVDVSEAVREAKVAKINAPFRKKRKSPVEPIIVAASSRDGGIPLQAPGFGLSWSYEGEGGPIHWGKLNAAWAKCDNGARQSPIDIRDGIKVDLEPIGFDYKPSRFNVIDNGHTVQVNLGGGNHITVMGRMYELVQFHFHRPSEERVNGKGFEMVAHLEHKDAEGRLAVVAVLLERGKAHALMQTIWNNLPLEKNLLVEPANLIDMNQFLPERREYYTYMGSQTTPPCSEGVLWMVLKEPVQVSAEQIGIFSRLYPMNARPIQATAGRMIKESN